VIKLIFLSHILNIMSDTETLKNLHENSEQPSSTIDDLRKELFERLKENENIPLASIIKEVKEHGVVSYLYNTKPTDDAFVWEHTYINELWFIHGGAKNMTRWNVYNYLTFKKEWDWARVCLNEVRRSSAEWYAHIKTLNLNEFLKFAHDSHHSK